MDEKVNISVVMTAYNAEATIGDAIESVLNQSYPYFEFIIVDDGSTDETRNIIQCYKDPRIRLVQNKHNYIGSLNIGIALAKGKFIARMDADDVMLRDRLKIQYAILEQYEEITVCSAFCKVIGNNVTPGLMADSYSGLIKNPLPLLLRRNFIYHPTTMIRKAFLYKHQIRYNQDYIYAEDYAMWVEIVQNGGILYVEPQPLIYYRLSNHQMGNIHKQEQILASQKIQIEIINTLIAKETDSRNKRSLSNLLSDLLQVEAVNYIQRESIIHLFSKITTVPIKWTNRSLKSLK